VKSSKLLDTSWLTEAGHGGLTIGIFGALDPIDVPVVRRMGLHAGSTLAIALDVDAWIAMRGDSGGAVPLLTQQGWRAVALGPRDRLDNVWQELGRSGAPLPRGGEAVVAAPGRVAR